MTEPTVSFAEFISGGLVVDETEMTLDLPGRNRTLLVGRSRVDLEEGEGREAMVVVVYDITRLKEFERQSARRERLSELGNLAAGVAHEIRNPLNTISIAAQRLAAEFSPAERTDDYRAFTQTIRDETSRLNTIITRFLALAREDHRKTTTVDLAEVTTSVGELLRPEAEKLGIDLTLEIDRGLTVRGDPDLLRQVLLNLYNNAKEALGASPGSIRIVATRESKQVVLLVTDNGPGIAPDLREKVLAPYFTTKEAGTGLGLPTVHKIISDLGGELSIESSDTGGAAIRILLPFQP